jgi:hypothetical protein
MYTEDFLRTHFAETGYSATETEVILNQFRNYGFDYLFDFAGQNCDAYGECAGWDGVDRRCECGNRRVYWVVEGGYAYGEAD